MNPLELLHGTLKELQESLKELESKVDKQFDPQEGFVLKLSERIKDVEHKIQTIEQYISIIRWVGGGIGALTFIVLSYLVKGWFGTS